MSLLEDLAVWLFPPPAPAVARLGEHRGQRVMARGRVVARDPIESPLSGTRCVYYRHVIEELRAGSAPFGGGGFWFCVGTDEAIAEFYVDDGTGRALVLPERADVTGGHDAAVDMPIGQRARERTLTAGAWVEVVGMVDEVEDLLDENRGYREQAARSVLCAPSGGVLRIRIIEGV